MFREQLRVGILIAVLGCVGGGTDVAGQIPEEFTNLQVLPDDISRAELVGIMRGYAGALGVRCNFCHVGEDPNSLDGYDFASDDKDTKSVARGMMRMLTAINTEHVPAAGRDAATQVGCVTCHRGVREPRALRDVILTTVQDEGVDAAVARYRELREEYYGRAAYDFGAGSLNSVSETLARSGNPDAALAVIQLNIEHNPEEPWPNVLEAQILMQSGQRDAAIRSMERAIELDPANEFYRQQLERMRSAG